MVILALALTQDNLTHVLFVSVFIILIVSTGFTVLARLSVAFLLFVNGLKLGSFDRIAHVHVTTLFVVSTNDCLMRRWGQVVKVMFLVLH